MDDPFFERLARLLEAERLAERAERTPTKESVRALAEKGLALVDLVAREEAALADRVLVTYGRAQGGDLGAGRIGVGSIVRVSSTRGAEAVEGIVARRSRGSVAVAFDEAPPEWAARGGRIEMVSLPSEVTWQRLAGAVRRVAEPVEEGAREVRGLVLGGWNYEVSSNTTQNNEVLSNTTQFAPAAAGASLNPEQRAAVEHALSGTRLTLVHGPPGTGKTSVLVEVVRASVAAGARVLCSAASNAAVDLLVERVAATGTGVVRLGHPARIAPAVLEHSLEMLARDREAARMARLCVEEALQLQAEAVRAQRRRGPGRFSESREARREAGKLFAEARRLEKAAELDVLDRTPVVAATLTSLDDARLAHLRFDLAVVDEATQALEPAAYLALLRAPRAVLAGDHKQLPPTILSEEAQRGGLGVSLFERLVQLYPRAVRALAVQHRMHEAIMGYPNAALYGGTLRAHPSVAAHTLADLPHVHGLDPSPLEFIDTAGASVNDELPPGSQSHRNPGEAELVVREVQALLAAGVREEEIAVIAPYDAQVQLLRQSLPGDALEIDTVDAFQGREKEVVVLSLTRSNDAGEVGFLADVRRMNVAITRARRKLIVVGDSATIAAHPFYRAFVDHVERHGRMRSVWEKVG